MRKLKDLSEYNWFNEFINKNILELFEIYYNNKKPLESIYFNGKENHFVLLFMILFFFNNFSYITEIEYRP